MAKEFGGWYDNPETGKNQRWWGEWGWTDGDDPTGGAGPGGAPSGDGGDAGGGKSEAEIFVDLIAQLAGSPTELPALETKPFEEWEEIALEELKPYYERILKEEGGDVERAKLRIEQDYERGVRISREDYEVAKAEQGTAVQPGETIQDYYNKTKDEYGAFPQEGIAQLDELMRSGVLSSGIATTDTKNMATSQQRRQEAIKRATGRYVEQAGIQRGRGLEDITTAWDRRQFELDEERKERGGLLGRQKRADDISLQEIERENLMRKAIQNVYA